MMIYEVGRCGWRLDESEHDREGRRKTEKEEKDRHIPRAGMSMPRCLIMMRVVSEMLLTCFSLDVLETM